MRDDEPEDRAAYEEGGRFVRLDHRGLAHIYDEMGQRIAREIDPVAARERSTWRQLREFYE